MKPEGNPFALLDVAAGIVLLTFFLRGCLRGGVREVAHFVALGGGLWVAAHGGARAAAWLRSLVPSLEQPAGADTVVAFVLLFFCVVVLVHLVARAVTRQVERSPLGGANRLAGGLFAALRAGCVIAVLVGGLTLIDLPRLSEPLMRTWTGRIGRAVLDVAAPIVPAEMRARLDATRPSNR